MEGWEMAREQVKHSRDQGLEFIEPQAPQK